MPPLVYGVLDVHPSHRIEVPDPARDAAAGRPDACTSCHVEADRTWAAAQAGRLWPVRLGAGRVPDGDHGAPRDALFAGDPIARALAAEALGRAPLRTGLDGGLSQEDVRAGPVRLLLESIEGDRYPAVRHLAARALARLLDGVSPAGAVAARHDDATGPADARDRDLAVLARAAEALPRGREPRRDRAGVAALRAEAARAGIDIGE
jgi:hypothetical protein